MALTSKEWAEIEALYKIGELSVRDIAKQFGITHGAISTKAKRENWERGSLKKVVSDVVNSSNQINQLVTNEQLPIINKVIMDKLQIKNMVNSIFGDALALQQTILQGTLTKLRHGDIDEMQAAQVLRSVGVSFDTLAKVAGIETTPEDNGITVNVVSYEDVTKTVEDLKKVF